MSEQSGNGLANIGRVFKGESIGEVFLKVRKRMLDPTIANVVPSRVALTKELLNPTIVISDPKQRLLYSEHRSYSLIYGIVEAYMLFNKTNKLDVFAAYNNNIRNYSDDGSHINSAYGYHIAEYLPHVIQRLKYDLGSRQAALNIYSTKYGLIETKDVPCTLNLHFLVRDNKLNLTVYMRSNDLFWGFQYDVFMFTSLQEIVANELGLELGYYTHCPTSLHVYEYHWDMLEQMDKSNTIFVKPISFETNIQGATSASLIISKLVGAEGTTDIERNGMARMLSEIKPSKYSPLHLVMLEYLYKHDKANFAVATAKQRHKLKNTWFAPFTKRWYTQTLDQS